MSKELDKIKMYLEKALAVCDDAYGDDEGDDEEDMADESDVSDEEESPKKKKSSKVDLAIAFMGPKDKK